MFVRINGILMISPLMVSSKNVKVSQKRCLGTSIESFTGSSPSEQIIGTCKEEFSKRTNTRSWEGCDHAKILTKTQLFITHFICHLRS